MGGSLLIDIREPTDTAPDCHKAYWLVAPPPPTHLALRVTRALSYVHICSLIPHAHDGANAISIRPNSLELRRQTQSNQSCEGDETVA